MCALSVPESGHRQRLLLENASSRGDRDGRLHLFDRADGLPGIDRGGAHMFPAKLPTDARAVVGPPHRPPSSRPGRVANLDDDERGCEVHARAISRRGQRISARLSSCRRRLAGGRRRVATRAAAGMVAVGGIAARRGRSRNYIEAGALRAQRASMKNLTAQFGIANSMYSAGDRPRPRDPAADPAVGLHERLRTLHSSSIALNAAIPGIARRRWTGRAASR